MDKRKSRAPAITELNFISSLPLEEAARLIGGLASPDMPVTLTEVDADTCRFELVYPDTHGASPLAAVEGTLRRWEGTFTRLDCTGDVQREPGEARGPGYRTLLVLAGVFLLSVLLAQVALAPGFILMFGTLAELGYLIGTRPSDEMPAARDKVYFRERDALLNLLIRAFTAAGDVSLDGTRLEMDDDAGVDAALDVLEAESAPKHKHAGRL